MSMKMSLLDIVQEILNDIDSDEVNDLDDTTESTQVTSIVKATYRAMMSSRNWPHTKRLIQLLPSDDLALPTHMKLQDEIKELCFVNYDVATFEDGPRRKYTKMKYLEPDNFLRRVNLTDNTATNVDNVIDPGTHTTLTIRNDLSPTYFTSFDDNTLIFDSYNSAVDDTLQAHKIQAYAYVIPEFITDPDFVPDLPVDAFTLLLEEAKSRSAMKLRQMADQKAEQEAQKQTRWMSRRDWRAAGGIKFQNYGRNGRIYRDPTFKRDN